MTAKKIKRPLGEIADDIRIELKRDTAGIIKLGELLAEAKRQVKRGDWLPWIDENFSMSEATAQRYLQVNKFLQSRNVRDLEVAPNLSASALYELSAKRNVFTPGVIDAIFNEAQQKRVDINRVCAISWSLRGQTQEEIQAEIEAEAQAAEEQEAAEQAEADAILDGPAPELPPPEPPAPLDFVVPAFDQAISKLKELSTKHSDKFRSTSHSVSDIEEVARFLVHVATIKTKAAA